MSIQTDIRKFLAKSGMTQAEFAALVGVHPIALTKFINRKGGMSIAERVAPFIYGEQPVSQQNAHASPVSELRPDVWPPSNGRTSTSTPDVPHEELMP